MNYKYEKRYLVRIKKEILRFWEKGFYIDAKDDDEARAKAREILKKVPIIIEIEEV